MFKTDQKQTCKKILSSSRSTALGGSYSNESSQVRPDSYVVPADLENLAKRMSDASGSDQRKSRAGMVAVQVTGGSALFVCLLCAPFLIVPAIHRIPWMATPPHIVRRAVQLASKYDDKGRHGLKVWTDLGSGDGRLPIDAVATGGYDRSSLSARS